ncbi:hypothetical protein D3C73_534820 [compost metagenome]
MIFGNLQASLSGCFFCLIPPGSTFGKMDTVDIDNAGIIRFILVSDRVFTRLQV